MGSARWIEDKSSELYDEYCSSPADYMLLVAASGADLGQKFFRPLVSKKGKNVSHMHLAICAINHRLKNICAKRYSWPKQNPDSMIRVSAKLYLGLMEQHSGSLIADYRPVSVPAYFVPRLEVWNKSKAEVDQSEVALMERCKTIISKVYKSRFFPPSLKRLIFNRDGYQCCNCGRGRDVLFYLGHHLEVDHKLPWVGGGKTTYLNGETLCNECNSAKHHTKYVAPMLALMRKEKCDPETR